MAQSTEAACLLQTGSMFRKRLGLHPKQGDPIFAGFKPAAFSLYFGDSPIYHFDLEGRWQRAFLDGVHYLKGLDGKVQTLDRVREAGSLVLKRHALRFAEASDLDSRVRTAAIEILAALGSGSMRRVDPPPGVQALTAEELHTFLETIARWDAAAWFAHRERYLAAYGPLPFLPPEYQNPVILQATLGHADARTFGLTTPADHCVRSATELEAHARAVAKLLGRRIMQCRVVFLGGSDVLSQSVQDVESFLERTARVFPVESESMRRNETSNTEPHHLEGIHMFFDNLDGPRPDRETWARYRKRHLVRVSLGVESGDPFVRTLYDRTWSDDDLRSTVVDLKAAGIGVGIVLLAGAGGVESAQRHVASSVHLINSLELGRGDLVSLIDAEQLREEGSTERKAPLGINPLPAIEAQSQLVELKQKLSPMSTQRGTRVAVFNLAKQGIY